MIEVQFTKDHGRFSKGDRRWVDEVSAGNLVDAKVARRTNHRDPVDVVPVDVVTVAEPQE